MSTNVIYPTLSYINDISNALFPIVTFTAPHDFTVGEIVSFRVTKPFGMYEINNLRAQVLAITSDTIQINIDTKSWTPFDYSAINTEGTSPPVCVPSGSGHIPYSFIPTVNIIDAQDNRRA